MTETDARIPLMYKPPQLDNMLDDYSKALSIRRMQARASQEDQMYPLQLKAAQMENDARERDLNDQKIWSDAYRKTGGDITKARPLAIEGGASPKSVQGVDAHQQAIRLQIAKTGKAEADLQEKNSDAVIGRGNAFLQKDDETKKRDYPKFLQSLYQDKHITPEAYTSTIKDHPEYPGDDVFQDWLNTHMTYTLEKKAADAQSLYAQRNATTARAQAATQETALKTEQEQTQQAATLLGSATDAADFADKLYSLPPKIRDKFKGIAGGEEFDQEAIRRAADQIGMTPAQRTTAAATQTRADQADTRETDTAAYRKAQLGIAGGRLAEERRRTDIMEDRQNKPTISATEATRQARASEKAENDQRAFGQRLAQAIQGGTIYIPKNGSPTPISTDAKIAKAQIDDMKAQYQANAEAMKTTIHDKYDAHERLGMTNPKVSRQAAIDAIDAGTQKLLSPPTAQAQQPAAKQPAMTPQNFQPAAAPKTAAAPPPAAAPKQTAPLKLTEAEARRRAKAAGLNPEQVEESIRQGRAKGMI